MTPLSKKEGAEVEVWGRQASGQMGVVIFSGQVLSTALNIFATASRGGHDSKSRRVLWTPSVCLNGPERTLRFVEVRMKMRHGHVKNIPEDVCTDG